MRGFAEANVFYGTNVRDNGPTRAAVMASPQRKVGALRQSGRELAAAAVAACAFGKDRLSRSRRILSLLGTALYSVYLFHLFCLNALFFVASQLPGFSRVAWLYVIVAALAANATGLVIHVFAEKPLTARLRDIAAKRSRKDASAAAELRPSPKSRRSLSFAPQARSNRERRSPIV